MIMNKTKMLLEKIDEEFLPYEDQVKYIESLNFRNFNNQKNLNYLLDNSNCKKEIKHYKRFPNIRRIQR
jgi:hypothetical protein